LPRCVGAVLTCMQEGGDFAHGRRCRHGTGMQEVSDFADGRQCRSDMQAAGISAAGPGGARRRGRRRRPVGRSPETEPPPVRARRRSRNMLGPPQCRSEPLPGREGASDGGDGDALSVGAWRWSRHRSGSCDSGWGLPGWEGLEGEKRAKILDAGNMG